MGEHWFFFGDSFSYNPKHGRIEMGSRCSSNAYQVYAGNNLCSHRKYPVRSLQSNHLTRLTDGTKNSCNCRHVCGRARSLGYRNSYDGTSTASTASSTAQLTDSTPNVCFLPAGSHDCSRLGTSSESGMAAKQARRNHVTNAREMPQYANDESEDNATTTTNVESPLRLKKRAEPTKKRRARYYRGPFSKHSTLSCRDINFLSSQTDLSPDQVRHIYMEFYKTCKHRGRLSRAEFKNLYKQLMGFDKHNDSIEHIIDPIFRAFDNDRSGYIEFGEFLVGFAIASKGDLEARLSYAFDCYDADYSEYIERDEIEPVLMSMMRMLGFVHMRDFRIENMISDIMQIADVSKDGRISKAEFIQALTNDEFVRGMLNPFN